jgi:hypothetical protein
MGFWDFMKKMATGKPVFEDQSQQAGAEHAGWVDHVTDTSPTSTSFVDERGNKIVPQVTIERCRSHTNGDRLDVTAWLTNVSPFEIELDRMAMLDMRTVLGRRLQPQEGHEVNLYHGMVPTSDHDQKAQLYYKIVQNGDNFCADYRVEYNRESNGSFTVEQVHPDNIIHDV